MGFLHGKFPWNPWNSACLGVAEAYIMWVVGWIWSYFVELCFYGPGNKVTLTMISPEVLASS